MHMRRPPDENSLAVHLQCLVVDMVFASVERLYCFAVIRAGVGKYEPWLVIKQGQFLFSYL